MNPRLPSRSGWTLSELLVGIALLAVLAALGLNTLLSLQQQGQEARCLMHLRTTTLAALRFFHDHNGSFFPYKDWYSRDSTHPSSPGMRDYLVGYQSGLAAREYQFDSVLTCPTLKRRHPEAFPTTLNRCYTVNRFALLKDPSSAYNDDEASRPPLRGGAGRLANVEHPSAMWLFTESLPLTKTTATNLTPTMLNELSFPHHQRVHTAFLDGHVEALAMEAFASPKSPRAFWGNLLAPN